MGDPRGRQRGSGDLGAALGLVLGVWTLLLGAALAAAGGVPGSAATAGAFALGTLWILATRPRRLRRGRRASAAAWTFGLLAGLASHPAWIGGIAATGLALGLGPRAPVPPASGDPLAWLAPIALAPLLEELLYRERLLPALERRLGALPAVLLSSAAFALPHLEPWTLLATFLVGLVLGVVMQLGGAVAICIGLHMGLNLAVALRGAAAHESPFSCLVSGAAAAALLVAAVALAQGQPHGSPAERARLSGGRLRS